MNEPKRENWTHYERLGVAEDASPEEIRRAHRKLVAKLHSDRKSGPYRGLFEELTNDVNAARDALLDPARRARHDAELAARRRRVPEAMRRTPDPSGHVMGCRGPKRGARKGPSGAGSGERGGERSSGARPGAEHGGRARGIPADLLGAFVGVEDHPGWHLLGASAFVATLYPVALTLAWAAGGLLGALAALAVPILGLVVPSRLRRAAARRCEKAAGGRKTPGATRLERAAVLARALLTGPLLLLAVTLIASGTPAGAFVGVLEVLVNSAFVAAQLYPLLWLVAATRAAWGRTRRPRGEEGAKVQGPRRE